MDEKIEDLDDTEVSDFLGIFEYQVTNQKYMEAMHLHPLFNSG